MPKRIRPAVEPLLPVTLPKSDIRYAPGIKAGRWIFATGLKGTDDFGVRRLALRVCVVCD